LAQQIAEHYSGIGITFSSKIADQYPSLRYLAPGSPTLRWLVQQLLSDEDGQTLSINAYGYGPTEESVEMEQRLWMDYCRR
jgi:hypothetical protein